jgi:L-malate glycosyltransferase
LLIDLEDQNRSVNNDLFETLTKDKSGASLLFVGTLAPHKAPHDLVALLLAYRELYDPNATLTLIGRPFEGRYATALAGYVKSLGLEKAVTITGSLPGPDLEAHWRTCDIFVCASNHEGFCVPLTEAMSHDVPIIAYGAAAIPETLGDAGLILDDKEPVTFAAGVHRVLSDDGLRHQLIAAGKQRLRIYDVAKATEAFLTGIHVVLTNASLTTRQEVSRRAN